MRVSNSQVSTERENPVYMYLHVYIHVHVYATIQHVCTYVYTYSTHYNAYITIAVHAHTHAVYKRTCYKNILYVHVQTKCKIITFSAGITGARTGP